MGSWLLSPLRHHKVWRCLVLHIGFRVFWFLCRSSQSLLAWESWWHKASCCQCWRLKRLQSICRGLASVRFGSGPSCSTPHRTCCRTSNLEVSQHTRTCRVLRTMNLWRSATDFTPLKHSLFLIFQKIIFFITLKSTRHRRHCLR